MNNVLLEYLGKIMFDYPMLRSCGDGNSRVKVSGHWIERWAETVPRWKKATRNLLQSVVVWPDKPKLIIRDLSGIELSWVFSGLKPGKLWVAFLLVGFNMFQLPNWYAYRARSHGNQTILNNFDWQSHITFNEKTVKRRDSAGTARRWHVGDSVSGLTRRSHPEVCFNLRG